MAARERTNGYALDKNHTFVVNMFDDFEKYSRVTQEYVQPETKDYQPSVSPLSVFCTICVCGLLVYGGFVWFSSTACGTGRFPPPPPPPFPWAGARATQLNRTCYSTNSEPHPPWGYAPLYGLRSA